MNELPYSFNEPSISYRYEFMSISAEKQIKKVVNFTKTDLEYVYNLALLDVLPNDETTDLSESKNKDMVMVLATVIKIIIDFLDKNPSFFVFIQGSDEKRQRLYQIMINREFEIISKQFKVFGGKNSDLEPFQTNRKYDFFIISKLS